MITEHESTWPICILCTRPIAPWFISHKATWVILGADRPMHEDCYLSRKHEGDGEAQETEVQDVMSLEAA